MVKLIFLGTSSTFPFPRTVANNMGNYADVENYQKNYELHDDIICSLAKKGGKERRTRSSLAIVTPEGTILIDAGPDVLYQTRKYKVKPDAVFITHDHSDAAGGAGKLDGVKVLSESAGSFKVGQELDVLGVKITPFRVNHAFNVPTCGYKIFTGDRKIAYMSDVANLEGTRGEISDCDIVIADGSNLDQNLPTHMSILTQLETYKKWGIKKVIFTHIGHKTLPHKDLEKYCRSVYAPTDIAYDGLQLIFS